ncbi:hypothetical protein [Methylobacterium nonmethylotrophicum]|uniref:DUF4350 domain-containing protein n=1 Tax=Methylobacterium nonmethylotrophicum TaxID=1141884 RepID=A0A4Z0NHR2_9HYPH|nr:hypothetical protein [Methylobacterium nonmethylotrophicum]TGD95126.1 hypothetical protein EU555_29565 [Methylobacterium nonmethylotrophicum]
MNVAVRPDERGVEALPAGPGAAVRDRIARMRAALAGAALLFGAGTAFLVSADLLGPVNPALALCATVLVLAALVAPAWRLPGSGVVWGARLAPVLPLVLTPLAGDAGQAARLFGTVAALAVLAHLPDAARRPRFAAAAGMVAFGSLIYLAGKVSVPAWHALDAAAGWISAGAGWLADRPVHLGPVAAGLWPLLLGLWLGLRAVRARPRAALLHVAAIAAATLLCAACQMPLERGLAWLAQAALNPPPQHLGDTDQPERLAPGALIGLVNLALLAVVAVSAAVTGLSAPSRSPPARAARIGRAAAGAGLLAAGVALLLVTPAPDFRPGRTVAFYDADLDLSRPVPGRYGLIQAGMYGGLWDLLGLAGYRRERVTEAQIRSGEVLEGIDALVVIMPRTAFAPAAHEAVWRFVERGGGLLVLGDHTDIWGVMQPINRLLAPVGVRIAYDSAYPLRRHWQYALDIRPHAVTRGVGDQVEIQIGTGASLDLSGGGAVPFLVGRYAFGDQGNLTNTGYGAGLGDYHYQVGERLGDVPVAAAARHGLGRVVVFGDTSSFQVLGVPMAADFVERVLRWLAQPSGGGEEAAWRPILGLGLALAGLAALWAAGPAMPLPVAAGAALAGWLGALLWPVPASAPLGPASGLAVVDLTASPRFPAQLFEAGSYGGLYTAVFRAGYLPVASRRNQDRLVPQAGLIAFVAPTAILDDARLGAVEALLKRGGTVLVADGRSDPQAANRVLSLCGLALRGPALGPARGAWGDRSVEMVDAWPVVALPGRTMRTDLSWNGHALVAETRVGEGRCIALGDARFLADDKFEGESQFNATNVAFVDALLRDELR